MNHSDGIDGTAQTAPTSSCAADPAASTSVDDADLHSRERLTLITKLEAGDLRAPYVTAFADSPTGEAFRQAIAPLTALED